MKARARVLLLSFFLVPSLFSNLALGDNTENNLRPKSSKSDPQWIWSAAHAKNKVPEGTCYFRKSLKLASPEEGEIQITADNQFSLFVNGTPVGEGSDWRKIEVFDISKHLRKGANTIAIEAINTDAGSAGLVARVIVKERGGTFRDYSTNETWKTSVRRFRNWTSPSFPESEWVAAKSYGPLGATLPWGNEMVLAGQGARFEVPEGFSIERLIQDNQAGSLIAMTFDSRGNIIASREGGGLYRIVDSDKDGGFDQVSEYCNQIKNVQGLLSLGSRVFAVGDGPEGVALYRLRDGDRDGTAEEIKSIVPIRGSRGEHGAHAVRLGPDGMLYVLVGNFARVGRQPGPRSPYRNWYEGHLIEPKEEDPRGHAVGIPAPGGTIFRTDANGSFVELVAGGFRNPYDFAFNAEGELFTYDADMEWDLGSPWYRPTRINHVPPGAEFGWRSGWAKWPDHFLDNLPPVLNVGPGSPTGVEFYKHHAYPEKYRGSLFGCDWATGKIYCFQLENDGASYRAESEVFVAGRPLNATDIAVGPDGAIYFCTGGRGTDGGIYRVSYSGEEADEESTDSSAMETVLSQPQLDADWARSAVARQRAKIGADWGAQLAAAAGDSDRSVSERVQALDLMALFGPRPDDQLLVELAQDAEPEIQAKAIRLMYASTSIDCRDQLITSLESSEPLIRRLACESLTRSGLPTAAEKHVRMLGDSDRYVAFAARRSLEQLPLELWGELVILLGSGDIVAYCRGACALIAASSDPETAREVLDICIRHLEDSNADYSQLQLTCLLRTTQLALINSKIDRQDVPELGQALLARYPTEIRAVDRELVRMLVHLDVEGAAQKFATRLQQDISRDDKMLIGAYAARLNSGWDTESKLALMQFYESAREFSGGYSVSAYVENFARAFFTKLSLNERRHVLAAGERWPTSALSVLARLPKELDSELLAELQAVDARIKPLCEQDDRYRRLRVGILATLGRSGDPNSLTYLRDVFRTEPQQRDPVAMSLTQHPAGDSWPYLIESLKTVRGRVAREVLVALATVPQRPREPEPYRQVILLGQQLSQQDAAVAFQLLDHWVGQESNDDPAEISERIDYWKTWYASNFPDAPPAELPEDAGTDKWSYEELLTFLESDAAKSASPNRGAEAFKTAQCIKCHRCGTRGETLGPDLTTVAQRFQKKEILESIVYPSHIISDQYASEQVVADGRTYVGLVVPNPEGCRVLMSDGEQVELAQEDIESIEPSRNSAMPTGLLNELSLQQVADLFAYLEADHRPALATKSKSKK